MRHGGDVRGMFAYKVASVGMHVSLMKCACVCVCWSGGFRWGMVWLAAIS